MVITGQILNSLLGFEASGIVSRVGKDVSRFKTGNKVYTLGHRAHRTLFRNKAEFGQPIPASLSFKEASTIPLVYYTAIYALRYTIRMRRGQTILVYALARGVG